MDVAIEWSQYISKSTTMKSSYTWNIWRSNVQYANVYGAGHQKCYIFTFLGPVVQSLF